MSVLWLRIRAPFGAYRWLQAGVHRGTSPTMPPSAAWGLVLNLAAIDSRGPLTDVVTQTANNTPRLRVALGTLGPVDVQTLYQQLHGYPVGASGKELAQRTHGSKYWIAPVRRELLSNIDQVVGVQSDSGDLVQRIRDGLAGNLARYGLPFLGDNNFTIDRVDVLDEPPPTTWFELLDQDTGKGRTGSCRLTIAIDRNDSSRTLAKLFAPTTQPLVQPPENAWIWVPAQPN